MTQTLDHVVVVHILIWDKRKSQINEYSDMHNMSPMSPSMTSLLLLYPKTLENGCA
jgi:hypothetical protein